MSGTFFKAVVQQVLLFGAETWVLTPRIERALEPRAGSQGDSRGEGGMGSGTTPLLRGP